MPHPVTTDIAIIGAGPVGIFTVFEMGLLGYRCVLLDSLAQAGGQLTELYPEKPIYDIPGFPTVLAGEIITHLQAQAAPFKPQYLLGEAVSHLSGQAGAFALHAGEHTVHAKVVVIAAGAGVFSPRKPPLPNLAEFEGKSVFFAVKNKQQLAGKTVVIAGGGDSATDWAVELHRLGAQVHLVHRRDDFRGAPATVDQLRQLAAAGKIHLHTPYQVSALHGTAGQLTHVTLTDLNGQAQSCAADALLCFFGLAPSLGPIAQWGLQTTSKKVVVDPATMATTTAGILAVGDITDYPGKLDLILTGFAEAAIAAKTAQSLIDPQKKFKLVYTTSSGVSGF